MVPCSDWLFNDTGQNALAGDPQRRRDTPVAKSLTTLLTRVPYLSNINGRVQTGANIHDNVSAEVLKAGGE